MAIITISRGCFSQGKAIAERVAELLAYECVSREILLEASQYFDIPEKELLRSIHDAPTILERITHGRERYLASVQAALLEHVKKDNVVYHGHAGHFLLPSVPHVLKVRVIAELQVRVAFLRKEQQMSEDEALDFIQKDDRHRAVWTRYLYKTEVSDPQLYDIVLNIGRLKIQDACDIISTAARSDSYAATPESKQTIENLALSSHVKVALQEICEAEVISDGGNVRIRVPQQKLKKTGFASKDLQQKVGEQIRDDLAGEILKKVKNIPGVKDVVCDIDLPSYS